MKNKIVYCHKTYRIKNLEELLNEENLLSHNILSNSTR